MVANHGVLLVVKLDYLRHPYIMPSSLIFDYYITYVSLQLLEALAVVSFVLRLSLLQPWATRVEPPAFVCSHGSG